jgi:hypothetical protein
MSEIEPRQLDEWRAAYELEPWGDDWMQTARLEAAILNAFGGDPVCPAELIPTAENARSGEVDDKELASRWKARLGM